MVFFLKFGIGNLKRLLLVGGRFGVGRLWGLGVGGIGGLRIR